MNEHAPGRLFRGNEFSRLLILLAITVSGWTAVWYYLIRTPAATEPETLVAAVAPAPIVADTSPEFETVTDKTVLSFRDSAAYAKLLAESRALSPTKLAARSRTDVLYAHLWQDPPHYRGVPIHIQGAAKRVLRYESKLSKTGWLYEAWVILPDLRQYPYVCVFEEAPVGFPIGSNISELVAFNGYFLKLMRYEAADTGRGAPLLVGRIGWAPRPGSNASPNRSAYWLAGALAVMFGISLVRWLASFRRSFRPPPPRSRFLIDRPNDEIAPEELSAFLHGVADDDGEGAGAFPPGPGQS